MKEYIEVQITEDVRTVNVLLFTKHIVSIKQNGTGSIIQMAAGDQITTALSITQIITSLASN